jgi:hypothetical protein
MYVDNHFVILLGVLSVTLCYSDLLYNIDTFPGPSLRISAQISSGFVRPHQHLLLLGFVVGHRSSDLCEEESCREQNSRNDKCRMAT